ncbi:MAG: tetratricopeptide repeat protein, partial [Candidatus Hodarchaeales archaeon]
QDCLKYYKLAMSISRELKSSFDTAKILHNMATVYSSIDELDQALDMFNRSSRLYESIGDFQGAGQSNSDAASVYIRVKKLTKAGKKLELAIMQLNKAELGPLQANSLAVAHSRKGVLYLMKNDKKQALHSFKMSLKGFKEAGNKTGIVSSLNSLVELSLNFDRQVFSIYFKELKDFFTEENDEESLSSLENRFGNVLL